MTEQRNESSARRRVRMPLSGGHMDVTLEGDASPETLDALRSVGEAAAAQTQGTKVGREQHTLSTTGLTAGAEHVKSAAWDHGR